MRREGPLEELKQLKRFVGKLEKHFLLPHLGVITLTPPSDAEVLDVASYIVLTHGAFENFIEGLSLWALKRLEQSWLLNKRATRCTASLLLFHPVPGENTPPGAASTVFNTIRLAVIEAKSDLSNKIQQNNGITPRHLKSLFRPLGVEIPSDPVLTASLDSLVSMRHEWAHQSRFGATVRRSARDVQMTVMDCISFAEKLSEEVRKAKP
jgi:hypothetical protein